ncbi:MAG: class I SAM-dependent methyltransferase [Halodesulfurarchaeum sp.]
MHDVSYFDRFAPVYDVLIPETDSDPLAAGLAMVDGPIECLLDLGGGTGRAAKALSEPTAVVDGSLPMLRKARAENLPSIRGDVRELPIATESVDGIVSVDAIHHFPDLSTVVEEVERVLRPGGAVVIRDFDPSTRRGSVLIFGEHALGFESTFYSPEALSERLHEAGLTPSVIESGFAYTVVGTKHA